MIDGRRAFEQLTRRLIALRGEKVKQSHRLEHAVVGVKALGRAVTNARRLDRAHARLKRAENACSDTVLKLEQFVSRSLEPLCPDRMVAAHIGQFSIDS